VGERKGQGTGAPPFPLALPMMYRVENEARDGNSAVMHFNADSVPRNPTHREGIIGISRQHFATSRECPARLPPNHESNLPREQQALDGERVCVCLLGGWIDGSLATLVQSNTRGIDARYAYDTEQSSSVSKYVTSPAAVSLSVG